MRRRAKVGRNDACPCGSGRKYKHCCETKTQSQTSGSRVLMFAVAAIVGAALIFAITSATRDDEGSGGRRVWSPEHGHWHDVP